jgi:hypothetical protein
MTHKLGGVDFVDNLMIVSGKSLVEGEKKREQNHRQQHLWWFGSDSGLGMVSIVSVRHGR